jgi:hypothetical protein
MFDLRQPQNDLLQEPKGVYKFNLEIMFAYANRLGTPSPLNLMAHFEMQDFRKKILCSL